VISNPTRQALKVRLKIDPSNKCLGGMRKSFVSACRRMWADRTGFRQKLNGNMPVVRERQPRFISGKPSVLMSQITMLGRPMDRVKLVNIDKKQQRSTPHIPMILDSATCMAMCGNGALMVGTKITTVRQSMAAFGMPLMIPDLESCVAVRGSAVRGTVVLLITTTARPLSLTTSSVFGWCAIFPGLLLSPLLFCPLHSRECECAINFFWYF